MEMGPTFAKERNTLQGNSRLASIMTRAPSNWQAPNDEGHPGTGMDNNEIGVGEALDDPPLVSAISNDPSLRHKVVSCGACQMVVFRRWT